MAVKRDRGAKALADRLEQQRSDRAFYIRSNDDVTERILGTTGLFIPDVTKHEPTYSTMNEQMGCSCGWREGPPTESYFDHIGTVS